MNSPLRTILGVLCASHNPQITPPIVYLVEIDMVGNFLSLKRSTYHSSQNDSVSLEICYLLIIWLPFPVTGVPIPVESPFQLPQIGIFVAENWVRRTAAALRKFSHW